MGSLIPHSSAAQELAESMSDPAQTLAHVTNMAVQAITSSVENKTEMRLHRDECAATRMRNETMFTETRQNVNLLNNKMDKVTEKLGEKIDTKHAEILQKINDAEEAQEEKQSRSNKSLYIIVGTLQGIGAAISALPLLAHFIGK